MIESKSADGVLEGLTRLGCEHGFPKYLLLDQDSSFKKVGNEAEVNMKDLELRSYKEHGIICKIAPVSGHNFTGLVERKIRTVQEAFEKVNLENKRLHSTGLQTLAKLIENDINNLPLGFSWKRHIQYTSTKVDRTQPSQWTAAQQNLRWTCQVAHGSQGLDVEGRADI